MADHKNGKKGWSKQSNSNKRPPQKSGNQFKAKQNAKSKEAKAIRWLVVAIGILLVLIVVFFVALLDKGNAPSQQRQSDSTAVASMPTIDGMTCDSMEGSVFHIHSHLTIFNNGKPVTVPANTGIYPNAGCLYWLHTHDTTGELHMEAPVTRTFTLGNFFDVWKQQLSKTQVMSYSNNGQDIKMYVDGQPYTGDPRQIVLKSHTKVVLEVGPTFVDPKVDTYTFPDGD